MQISENDFFRAVAMRICGSLEIEKALRDCLMYIRDYIPADMMLLHVHDPGTGVSRILAKADLQGAELASLGVTVTEEGRRIIDELIRKDASGPHIIVADRVNEHPLLGPLTAITKNPNASVMSISPEPKWNLYGGIFIGNQAGTKYTDEHVKLFALLNEPFAIALSNYLRYQEVLRLKDILADDNRFLNNELRQRTGDEIIGADLGLKQIMKKVHQVAPLTSPVLLLGETGVGKEVVATAIHSLSPRRNAPFIRVNCGAIPESLLDSELFGYEKGAFTGALWQQRGRFERADGGTIFLDEIGELTPAAQVRLLRVIQEKEVERLGGKETLHVNIRVIAATHSNLDAMVKEGKFRDDLYFRIGVFPLVIPPLRERRVDIPALVRHFTLKKAREMGLAETPVLAPGAIDRMIQYSWPGNVRELQNVIERAIILSEGRPLTFDALGEAPGNDAPDRLFNDNGKLHGLDRIVSQTIVQALEATKGCVGGKRGAAKLLNMNPSTLRAKMRKLGIPFGRRAGLATDPPEAKGPSSSPG